MRTTQMRRERFKFAVQQTQAEIVILIHGTGAAESTVENPKWWDHRSEFVKDLCLRLGPGFELWQSPESHPFQWSGANSERDRRAAGGRLLVRLQELERLGRTYHLVGHSHGGSVIWHLLRQAVQRGIELKGLGTWTTVGTPFLEFAPIWLGITSLIAAILAGLYVAFPLSQMMLAWFEGYQIWRDGSSWGIALAITLCLSLLVFVLLLAYVCTRWLISWAWHHLRRRWEKKAAARYGPGWLALWHPEDEPINGLMASLISPIQLAPRGARENSSLLWRFIATPYDRLVAPVTDQFVWITMMSRLQDGDLNGCVMVDAGSAPSALSPGWQALPKEIADEMSTSAGLRASNTVSALRQSLTRARASEQGSEVVGAIAASVTWSEIVHTSYFDFQSVRNLIATHIISKGKEQSGEATPSSRWLSERPRAALTSWPKPFRPYMLSVAKIVFFGGLAALLATSWRASFDAYIWPHMRDYQVREIANRAISNETIHRESAELPDVIARLSMLSLAPDTDQNALDRFFLRIFDRDTRIKVAQRLAYNYGFRADWEALARLRTSVRSTTLHGTAEANTAVLVHGLAGANAGGQKPADSLIDTVVSELQKNLGPDTNLYWLLPTAIPVLID